MSCGCLYICDYFSLRRGKDVLKIFVLMYFNCLCVGCINDFCVLVGVCGMWICLVEGIFFMERKGLILLDGEFSLRV